MRTYNKAPEGAVRINAPEGASPVIRLSTTPEARAWAEGIIRTAEEQLQKKAYAYLPPEHEVICFHGSARLVAERLLSKGVIETWEIARGLVRENVHFNNAGFEEACVQMFG